MNNPFGISDKSYNILIDALRRFPEVKEVIIFGSRAKGNYKNGSDIDLAIKGNDSSPLLAMNINGYLNETLPTPYFVDVVDYNSLTNIDLKSHIDRVGLLFYKIENRKEGKLIQQG